MKTTDEDKFLSHIRGPKHPMEVVAKQAEDDGLWFNAVTGPEAYLQQELRKLHSVVEAYFSPENMPSKEEIREEVNKHFDSDPAGEDWANATPLESSIELYKAAIAWVHSRASGKGGG